VLEDLTSSMLDPKFGLKKIVKKANNLILEAKLVGSAPQFRQPTNQTKPRPRLRRYLDTLMDMQTAQFRTMGPTQDASKPKGAEL
jgi:hypothetical protein